MIFKGLHPLSFRVDLPKSEKSTAEILKFFEQYEVVKYYGNPEIGKETEKPHYQMIIWTKKEMTSDDRTKMRNFWRGKVKKKKGGGASVAKARSEVRLFGYCRKEEKNDVFTNVSKEIYSKIKKVDTIKALKEQNAQKLEKIIGGISRKLTKYEYLEALNNAYFQVYQKPNLFRNYYVKHLFKAGYMDDKDIIHYVFPHDIPGGLNNQDLYELSNFEKNKKENMYK